jgi:hypothetical protein
MLFCLFPFMRLCVPFTLFTEIPLQVEVPLPFLRFCIWHTSVLTGNIWNTVCILSCSV